MDKMEQDQNEEEKALFKEWRHNFELKLRQHIENEILLIREMIIVKIELGQQQKFVLEGLKVELMRDFRVRMTPRGRIVPKSTRQILTPETQRFTNRHEISGKSTRKAKKTGLGRASEGYATIEGGEEGDKGPTVPSLPKTVQLRPRLPTTPIPRSLPASLLASPSTPQQDIMPTAATLLSAPTHLEQLAAEAKVLAKAGESTDGYDEAVDVMPETED
uniref:Not3 domain-containing protein n=1 Tax=Globodera pallida TaxID=36090 RepID=A0A183CDT1_GLOPA